MKRKIYLALFVLILTTLCLFSCNEARLNEEIDLSGYKVIISENADTLTEYCADNFVLTMYEKFQIKLPIAYDTETEQDKEILIGKTNREESQTKRTPKNMQYQLFKVGDKIVIQGNSIYVGSGCGAFLNDHLEFKDGKMHLKNMPTTDTPRTIYFENDYKSVIFMIGDGMGQNHIEMAEWDGLDHFVARDFYSIGTVITQSQSVIEGYEEFTDSTASATAMATGTKTYNSYVGVDKDKKLLLNIREIAYLSGARTGVLTTDVITGGTPSSYLCHLDSRNETELLQLQIDELVANRQVDYLGSEVGDDLTKSTREALYRLNGENGFFLMIEEAHIDKASAERNMRRTINCVIRYNDAVTYASQFALMHPDVALIVTADHETGGVTSNEEKTYYTFTTKEHTNVDVPFFAIGAGVNKLKERIDNTQFFEFCKKAYEKNQ
ncbi:MAG: alkaline phosphatase [Clostridia bacterium]|nr:alkaline phosphatase [Clostridia bacterium]